MPVQAARTVCVSGLVTAATPSARYATTAPIQPTEHVRWTVSANFRTPGVMITALARRALGRWSPAYAWGVAGEVQSSKQQDQDDGADPERLHPTWGAGRRFAVWLPVASAPSGYGRVSRVDVLGWSDGPRWC